MRQEECSSISRNPFLFVPPDGEGFKSEGALSLVYFVGYGQSDLKCCSLCLRVSIAELLRIFPFDFGAAFCDFRVFVLW